MVDVTRTSRREESIGYGYRSTMWIGIRSINVIEGLPPSRRKH